MPDKGGNSVRFGDVAPIAPATVAWMCVQLGWRVVPARPGAKRPALAGWTAVASADPDVVGAWWTGEHRGANACVVTGRESGIWVLDVDEKSGGYAALARLIEAHGELPRTFAVKTPGGGMHLYWTYPGEAWGEVKTGVGSVGAGLDVRGLGGQVMAPGSVVGGMYRIVDEQDAVADAPDWLLAMVRRPDGASAGDGGYGEARLPDAQELLEAAGDVPAGEQERALFAFLCKLRTLGWEPSLMAEAGWRYAGAFANVAGHPAGDWTRAHVAAKVEHVVKTYPAGGVRAAPVTGAQAAWAARRTGGGPGGPEQAAGGVLETVERAAGPDESDRLTGTGNAHRFAARYGADARYVAGVGWHLWDGGVWREDRTGLVLHWTEQIGRDVYEQWGRELDAGVSKTRIRELSGHYNRTCSGRGRQEMLTLAQAMPHLVLTPEDLDTDRWALRVANGTLDLHTGRLRGSLRQDHHTRSAGVAYDPDAACPNFLRFITGVQPDPLMAGYVQRMFGYCLTGDTSEQAFFFLQGVSGAGKSTLCDILRILLGGYGAMADEDLLYTTDGHPTNIMELLGKRLVVHDELSKTRRLDTARINKLTGSPTIKGRRMREDFVDVPIQVKLMLNANNLPGMGGSGVDGIWRRMKLMTFTHAVPGERVKDYARLAVETEGAGILNWALEGLAAWRMSGLADPESMRAAVGDYQEAEDVTGQFVAECVSAEPGAWLSNPDLMAAYLGWCKANGHRALEGAQMGKWLKQARFVQSRPLKARRTGPDGGTVTKTQRGWMDVRLEAEQTGGFLTEKPWEPVGDPRAA